MKTFFLSAGLALFGSSAVGEDAASCVGLENDIARLACFDRAFESEVVTSNDEAGTSNEATEEVEVWERSESRDAISDRRNVSYIANPTERQFNSFGGVKQVFLQLRCRDNTTMAVIYFDDYQIRNDRVRVTVRRDLDTPEEMGWTISSNNKAAGLWNGREAIPFIKSLVGVDELVMRLRLNDGIETYVFKMGNVGEKAQDLADACGWSLE